LSFECPVAGGWTEEAIVSREQMDVSFAEGNW
jgi:hypothetical protein